MDFLLGWGLGIWSRKYLKRISKEIKAEHILFRIELQKYFKCASTFYVTFTYFNPQPTALGLAKYFKTFI